MEENKNEITVMTVEESQAVQADDLVNNGLKLAQMGIAQMCAGVRMMHDGKLYKHFGFQNFEDYCKSKGFSKSYGERLVRVAAMLEEKNAESIPHFEKLGTAKLFQLAMLEPEQREEIIQTVDVESVTVKELKSEISTLKQNKQQLESQIQELENRPVEVMQSTAELEEIQRLENRIAELENQEQSVSDAEEKRFAEFASSMNQQLVEERQRLKKESQEEISRANLQRDNAFLEVEKLKKQLAEQKEDSPEMKRFKVRIATLCDSIEQLVKFLCEHADSAFIDKSETVIKGAETSLSEIRKQVQA